MSLLQMSFSGAVMIVAILLIRMAAINKLPKMVFVVLWEIAFLRLLIPISVPSVFSAYSMIRENHITQEVFTEGAVSYLIPEAQEIQFAVPALIPETQEVQSAVPALIPETQEIQSAVPALIPETQEIQSAVSALISETQEIQSAVSANVIEEVQHDMSATPAEAVLPLWKVLWIAGMIICALFFLITYLRCYREFRMSLPVSNVFAEKWLKEHQIKRGIRIRQSDRISSPLTYGIFRPVILMPKTTDWEDIQRLQYVLQHEYVHIRRFDMIRKLVAALVLCIHWFNPAVWLMYLVYNRDIELSCDERVIRRFGESSKPLYAKALIAMEEKRNSLQPLSNSFSKNAIEERIKAVMKTKKVTVWAAIISIAVIVIIILVFATSANIAEHDEQENTNLAGEDTTPSADNTDNTSQTGEESADIANSTNNADNTSQTGEDSVISSVSANTTEYYVPDDNGWYEVSGEDVIAFFDTITEDMLDACGDEYPSMESYWNDPIVLLNRWSNVRLYGISANGQDAMLLYIDGEKILIKRSFRNLYQWEPELNMYDIDKDGMQEVIISLITITGNPINRYGMAICDYTDTWNVYVYEDYLNDIEEAIQWQYDEQEKSVLFMNNENIILTDVKLPEWTEEYPFAGNVKFNDYFVFDAILMQLRVVPYIELERSLPYWPIEIVFQVEFKNGDFSLGSYYIRESQRGPKDSDNTPDLIGTEYTGEIDGISLSEYIEKYVTLTDDIEIERWEMLNHNGENILRIRVGYNQDDLRGTIQGHKEDYFIFLNGNGEAGYVLQVGYEDKHVGMACGYSAHFEDVTFDGNDDLLICLGGSKAQGYCAFIYENGQYRYEKSFENIPDYEVDAQNHVIRGSNPDSATAHTYLTFEYRNGEFVKVEVKTIQIEYRDGRRVEVEYINGVPVRIEEVE